MDGMSYYIKTISGYELLYQNYFSNLFRGDHSIPTLKKGRIL